MDPLKISAQFAAFIWFQNRSEVPKSDRHAWEYARRAWRSFLPFANEGVGRLLMQMAKGSKRRESARRDRALAIAG
jgi:hypothetical protein